MNLYFLIDFINNGIIKIFYCALILIAGFIIIKLSSKLINTFFNAQLSNLALDAKKAATLSAVLRSIVRYAIVFVMICSILIHLGVPSATLTAVLGTGTVAIGLAAQSVIKDAISGFFILLENQFSVGDLVTIEDNTGIIENITIRTTLLRSFDGTLHVIPNGNITIVSNMCKGYMNAIVNVTVSYKEDIENILAILNDEMEIAGKEISALKSNPIVMGVADFATVGVTIRIMAECMVKQNVMVERELRLRIKNRFDKENIRIPSFPNIAEMTQK